LVEGNQVKELHCCCAYIVFGKGRTSRCLALKEALNNISETLLKTDVSSREAAFYFREILQLFQIDIWQYKH